MKKRILGIDPGSLTTGWGIIEERSGVLSLIACDAINAKGKGSFNDRLTIIYNELKDICQDYSPHELAIEQVFVAKNALSALKLGQARGVAMAVAMQYNMPIFDYEPTKVKSALVGSGRAQKEQVAFMVQTLLNAKKELSSKKLDVTDALALAICHANTMANTMANTRKLKIV